jgi:hypothetical protein
VVAADYPRSLRLTMRQPTPRRWTIWISALGVAAAIVSAGDRSAVSAQQPPATQPKFAVPTPVTPLFFREVWRQTTAFDASTGFEPERAVTPAAVTQPNLELKLYDPRAAGIAQFLKNPPAGSIPRDWGGPSCVQLAGYNQNPPPERVVAGQPSDPPNLWTGVCQTAVAVTLRDRTRFVDLRGLARIRWVTRTSGFHVVRPVLKLADGTFLVGDYAEGLASANSTLFLESEFALANVRWLSLDIDRVVTRGTWVENPDLSRVDEVGFADLMAGSGHGWGGFINVSRFEVYGTPVPR